MLSLTPAKPAKVAEIYLSKEQINAQTPGNLLHTFFTNVRPPKKVLEDQLTQVGIKCCIALLCALVAVMPKREALRLGEIFLLCFLVWTLFLLISGAHLWGLLSGKCAQPCVISCSPHCSFLLCFEDPEKIRGSQAKVWQEQVQQGWQRAAPGESCEHQAACHKTPRQGEGRAQQCQVRSFDHSGSAPNAFHTAALGSASRFGTSAPTGNAGSGSRGSGHGGVH